MGHRPKRFLAVMLACSALGLLALRTHVADPADPPASPAPWALLRWDEAVGRTLGQEADSEGPKSFAVKPDGGVLVLDQVNSRILDLDSQGNLTRTLALPAPTFDDVEQMEGRVLVLDRLVTRTLLVMGLDGSIVREAEVQGRGIENSGLVTALIPRADGVWLEVAHRYSVKVLDRNLEPCERQVVTGRPVVNGRSLQGELDGRGGVVVSTSRRADRVGMRSVSLEGQLPVRRIVWLDMDAGGRIHAVLHEAHFSHESPYSVRKEQYAWVVLDESLGEVRRTYSPWVLTLYDQRVEFRLGPDGRVWQMAFTEDGVRIVDWGRGTP